jgi:hypothetical protein
MESSDLRCNTCGRVRQITPDLFRRLGCAVDKLDANIPRIRCVGCQQKTFVRVRLSEPTPTDMPRIRCMGCERVRPVTPEFLQRLGCSSNELDVHLYRVKCIGCQQTKFKRLQPAAVVPAPQPTAKLQDVLAKAASQRQKKNYAAADLLLGEARSVCRTPIERARVDLEEASLWIQRKNLARARSLVLPIFQNGTFGDLQVYAKLILKITGGVPEKNKEKMPGEVTLNGKPVVHRVVVRQAVPHRRLQPKRKPVVTPQIQWSECPTCSRQFPDAMLYDHSLTCAAPARKKAPTGKVTIINEDKPVPRVRLSSNSGLFHCPQCAVPIEMGRTAHPACGWGMGQLYD